MNLKNQVKFNNLTDRREEKEILLEGIAFEKVISYLYLCKISTMNSNTETEVKKSITCITGFL